MSKKSKRMTKRKWIALAAVAAAVALVAVFLLPQFLRTAPVALAMTRTATVEKGTIETTVAGSGNMTAAGTMEVKLPSGVSVDSVLVEAGDTVAAGDTLAILNEASLAAAILDTQDELAAIDQQLDDVKNDTESRYITSSISGRVKQIFAEEGAGTQDTVSENGSLMVLSIDGKMKVTLDAVPDTVSYGDVVKVTLPDGSMEEGTVAALADASCTVTVTDNGPAYGDIAVVTDEEGNEIGTGTLEINAPIRVLGGTGIVESIDVELNELVSSGTTLVTLQEAAVSREYEELLSQRTQYEEVLTLLLKYAGTGSIVAQTGGTVSEVSVTASGAGDTASAAAGNSAAAGASGMSASMGDTGDATTLAVSLGGESDMVLTSETDFAAVTPIGGTIEIDINHPVANDTPQSTIMPGTGYTGSITWLPADQQFAAETVYEATVVLKADAGYRFADDAKVSVTGAQIDERTILVSPEAQGNTLTFTATFPAAERPEASGGGSEEPAQTPAAVIENSANTSAQESESLSLGAGGMTGGGAVSAATVSAAETAASAGTDDSSENALITNAFTLLTGSATTLTVNVDELDILSIEEGQKAAVALDAFPDDIFTGTVTKISSSGNQQTGVTTYPVTITLQDADDAGIKAGMNANATILVATSEDVLTIPLAALQEAGSEQYVFVVNSSADQEEGSLGERRTVTTGLSDGTNVEIVSGLSEGEQIAYTEAQASNESEEQAGFGGMGGGPGADMGGGMMPDSGGAPGGMPGGPMS